MCDDPTLIPSCYTRSTPITILFPHIISTNDDIITLQSLLSDMDIAIPQYDPIIETIIVSLSDKFHTDWSRKMISIHDTAILLNTHPQITADILLICDKLQLQSITTKILNLCTATNTNTITNNSIINHTSRSHEIIDAYSLKYPLVFNNKITYNTKCANLATAIQNGMYIQIMAAYNGPTNILEMCTSIKELRVYKNNGCSKLYKSKFCSVDHVTHITSFAKSLKILSVSGRSNLRNWMVHLCTNITELCVNNDRWEYYGHMHYPNYIISNCNPFAASLKILSAYENSTIGQEGIMLCKNIEELYADDNSNITSCANFAHTLRYLSADGYSGICDHGLVKCNNIIYLSANQNRRITTCKLFADSLRFLFAEGGNNMRRTESGITDSGLNKCKNIILLNVKNNQTITTCTPFAKSLEILFADGSNIDNEGISRCTNLKELYTSHAKYRTSKITVMPPTRSLQLYNEYTMCSIYRELYDECVIYKRWDTYKRYNSREICAKIKKMYKLSS